MSVTGPLPVWSASGPKVHRHAKAPLETFEVPERRFDHVNVDSGGPPAALTGVYASAHDG